MHSHWQNRIKRLEGDVKEYVDAHRAELDGKSRTLVFGKVGYRASSKLMLGACKSYGSYRRAQGPGP